MKLFYLIIINFFIFTFIWLNEKEGPTNIADAETFYLKNTDITPKW